MPAQFCRPHFHTHLPLAHPPESIWLIHWCISHPDGHNNVIINLSKTSGQTTSDSILELRVTVIPNCVNDDSHAQRGQERHSCPAKTRTGLSRVQLPYVIKIPLQGPWSYLNVTVQGLSLSGTKQSIQNQCNRCCYRQCCQPASRCKFSVESKHNIYKSCRLRSCTGFVDAFQSDAIEHQAEDKVSIVSSSNLAYLPGAFNASNGK